MQRGKLTDCTRQAGESAAAQVEVEEALPLLCLGAGGPEVCWEALRHTQLPHSAEVHVLQQGGHEGLGGAA